VTPTARVKLCGITRLEDAELAASLGAWAIGFIFHEASPRYIDPARARAITERLPAHIKKVGVFVNRSREEILATARASGITAAQLHGEEAPPVAASLEGALEVIQAFRPKTERDIDKLPAYRVSAYLIDAHVEGGPRGGTGALGDWSLARAAKAHGPVILAGGLTPANAARAWAEVSPFALDVSSGVEASPGVKSHAAVRAFFEALQGGSPS
jgi:phosphoribosylanthranilate isomerase